MTDTNNNSANSTIVTEKTIENDSLLKNKNNPPSVVDDLRNLDNQLRAQIVSNAVKKGLIGAATGTAFSLLIFRSKFTNININTNTDTDINTILLFYHFDFVLY